MTTNPGTEKICDDDKHIFGYSYWYTGTLSLDTDKVAVSINAITNNIDVSVHSSMTVVAS